jgi:hypothetical protein
MPVFTAAAAYISTAIAGMTFSSVASLAARTLLTIGIAKLLSNRSESTAPAGAQDNTNARVQLNPSTANKLPMIYGSAFVEGAITDAKISTDQQTMWYVIALSEYGTTNAASITWNFDAIYWNNNELTFDNTDNTKVISWSNNADPVQTSTKINGKMNVYLYRGNSYSPYNTALSAIDVLSDADIPVDQRWTSTDTMEDTIFMVVKMKYDRDAGTTNVGNFKALLTNTSIQPGTAIYDYMTDTTYGCAIPAANVDTASLIALNTYSDEYIDFTSSASIVDATQDNPCIIETDIPHGLTNESKITISGVVGMTNLNGNTYYVQVFAGFPTLFALYNNALKTSPVNSTGYPAYVSGGTFTGQLPRYRINGPIATGSNCLDNLQQLVDGCDSWLQYSELNGQWRVVINKPYTGLEEDLYLIDDSNLVTGIEVNPIDLNQTYNQLEVQYPNFNIRDQYDFPIIKLEDYFPNLISPNEAPNKLTINLPQVNNSIQSTYIGIRRLLQSREDLVITFSLDYSGIQVEAGDVIRVKFAPYGWDDPIEFPNGKLFRVSQVQETKTGEGFLGVHITAFEYNGTVYYDNPLANYVPADNTGLTNPNIISAPGTPTIADLNIADNTIDGFTVTSTVPTTGVVLYMDFNYGTSSDVTTHRLYRTTSRGNGTAYTPGATVTVTVNDLPAGSYYWSITARNNSGGSSSAASAVKAWAGQNVTTYAATTKTGVSSVGATVTVPDTTGIRVGDSVEVVSGTGDVGTGNTVAAILGPLSILLAIAPLVNLASAAVKFFGGGLPTSQVKDGAITPDKTSDMLVNTAIGFAFFAVAPDQTTVVQPVDITGTSQGDNIPVYINGTTVSSSLYFPYRSGTSATTNGYFANSTGAYTPATASYWAISNGQNNWWSFVEVPLSVSVPAGYSISTEINFQVVSDADTIIQTTPYSRLNSATTIYTNDQTLESYVLKANVPYTIYMLQFTGGEATVTHEGYLIRNLVGSTRVDIVSCNFTTFARRVSLI